MTPAISAAALAASLNTWMRSLYGRDSVPITVRVVVTGSGYMLQISTSVEQRRYLGEFLWKRMALFPQPFDEPLRIPLDQAHKLLKVARDAENGLRESSLT
jgi:hypothetical protein